jgi:hypothetical protein
MKRPFPFHSNLVWPPPVLVCLFIVIYSVAWVSFWLIGLSVPAAYRSTIEMPEGCRAVIIGFAAASYAALRLWRFHPASNRGYSEWLKLSPWTADQPLPAGPVHLVWQDAAVLGVLTAIGVCRHFNPMLPVTTLIAIYALLTVATFMFVYLIGFTCLLAFTRQWGPCLVLGFLWPTLMLPGVAPVPPSPPILPAIGIVAAIICVIWYGHQQSLKAFPWEFIKVSSRSLAQAEIRIKGLGNPSGAGTQYNLGWPYLMLSPKVRPPAISQRTNFALGALAGWWSYCIIKASPADATDPTSGFILFFAILAALARLGVYAIGLAAPFNIPGRIVTGRILVPGFDKVFMTPLAVVVTAIIGGIIINHSGDRFAVTASIVIAVLFWVLFGGGPTLRCWALTGQFRIRPPASVNANKQIIRQV